MRVAKAAVPLTSDVFLRRFVTELTASLEEVIGREEATGYIGLAGQRLGDALGDLYTRELDLARFDREQIAEVLVDLYRRIQGEVYIISADDDRIVLGNRSCPFGGQVRGNEAMCMLTSSVFGTMTARHLGYAKVDLSETIAARSPRCRIVIHLRPGPAADGAPGNEYYDRLDPPPPAADTADAPALGPHRPC
ncbi:putative ArsR family transcriptional regulator [Streptomonospora nanhaiensis]|uniref:Putative ArsR family transcriptional regulator n=1 Tax=Streptomonospora nanhaiensis TaxID=1323731 RepID=A0A853BQZ6_9ACTN|nr:methanogen output domain 1-containing protein [Streptomonospora nanhaiensis]NYI97593.1 putative ArsR family transcriptional regulator [Streptomonospora nanhaiensis]